MKPTDASDPMSHPSQRQPRVPTEQAAALERARRWCDERGARVAWDERETRCQVRVDGPRGTGWIDGAGAGFYEAYVECRTRYDAAAAPGGPPSSF